MTEKVYGLYSGGFKPFHKGHWEALNIASQECDIVTIFVSTQDRIRKNEFPIYAEPSNYILNNFIRSHFPMNIITMFVPEPIKAAMEQIGRLNEHAHHQYGKMIVYGDEKDLTKTYGDFSKLEKVCGNLVKENRIELRYTPRICSGTQLRYELQHGLEDRFKKNLPDFISYGNKTKIYNDLREPKNFGTLVKVKPDQILVMCDASGKQPQSNTSVFQSVNVFTNNFVNDYFLYIKNIYSTDYSYRKALLFFNNRFYGTNIETLIHQKK